MPGLSSVNEPVPHTCVRRLGHLQSATYAGFQQTGTTPCRLCGLCAKVLEAFAKGEFPALFQGVDEVRSSEVLEKIDLWPEWSTTAHEGISTIFLSSVHLLFMGIGMKLLISRECTARAFAVEGVSFYCHNRIECPFHGEEGCLIASVPRPSNKQYSDRSLGRANKWLQDCLEQHDCGKSDFYPKRLLDLRGGKIRLFESNEFKNLKAPYVCLSHRWGSSGRRLTSTVANIDNHMNGIPGEDIPRTFRDAIAVCRHLSVSYLWIDTVCILQEFDGMSSEDRVKTEADFAAENSAMARIYRNSHFTICASMSTSMDSGMFPTKYEPWIKVTADDGIEASFRISAVHSHNTPPTDLETRGWTYQEYLLPPRILEFGPLDISWKCKKEHFCECEGEDESFTADWGWRRELARQMRPPGNIQREAEQWWIKTVQHYTGRNLTNHQDKLPALSGLAQMYREVMDDTYLAGLWKASLPYNLCWYHCSNGFFWGLKIGIGRRPRPLRAPSWSWASIDALHSAQCHTWWPGTVEDPTTNIYESSDEVTDVREVCTVYEVTVEPQTSDPFGMVSPGGFLKLGVTLISAKIDTEAQGYGSPDHEIFFSGSVAWTLYHFNDADIHVNFCVPDCELDDNHLNIRDGLDENRLKIGDEVHCAPIVERLSEKTSERGCLVLKRQQDQEYQRVGFCILVKENPNYDWWAGQGDDRWEPNAPGNRSYALQWSSDTETQIKIV